MFGDSYETTIGRKLKKDDIAKHPELGHVGDKVRWWYVLAPSYAAILTTAAWPCTGATQHYAASQGV